MRAKPIFVRLALIVLIIAGLIYAPAIPVRAAPPSNDDFDNATLIGALPFAGTRDTREATYADDDPQCTPMFRTEDATVWYAYTPTSDQQVLISTAGSSYQATLAVFTGTRGSLSQVASLCGQPPSELRFDAVAATTYYIQVGVFTSTPISELAISLVAVAPPSNDDIATATAITSLPFTAQQDTRAATASAGDPFCSGQGRTVWYKLTAPASERLMIANWGSSYSAILGVYTGTPDALNEVACSLQPPSSPLLINAVAGTTYFIVAGAEYASQAGTLSLTVDRVGGNDNIAAAFPVGELPLYDARDPANFSADASDPACFEQSVTAWYRYTPPVAQRLRMLATSAIVGVYSGVPGQLTELACGVIDRSIDNSSYAAINAVAGATYYIGVGVPSDLALYGGYTIRISAGPGNDDFDAATSIAALPFSVVADLRGSSAAPDDPPCGSGNLWYVYHAVDDRLLEVTARSTAVNMELGVYTGSRGSLVQQACGVGRSDPNGQWYSSAIFRATAGETYFIIVGTNSNVDNLPDARFTLNLDAAPPTPANDDFDDATILSDLPFSETQDSRLATTAIDDPACYGRTNTYWYAYTPQSSERVFAKVMSGASSVLGVYTGVRGNLHQVSCTDEPFNAEFVFLDLSGGTTYYFMVASAADNGIVDQLIFELERVPPPPPLLKLGLKI
ncbi:MAG TPA: hypothetical protein VFO07_04345, partial [Roseiflexaceae bacterium]|nr:hypothetical protein [Roseiflexaceae bacterium]